MWLWFALGSAVFAALTSIRAKIGIEGVDSHLALAFASLHEEFTAKSLIGCALIGAGTLLMAP